MTASDRPNIIFIFADDWGWGDLGCYGHPLVRTPNLDRMAQEGVLFTQFYVCSGVCSPSRAAAMTGMFPARLSIHGHLSSQEHNALRAMPDYLDPNVMTVTRLLQQAGYAVGHYGKWHLGFSPDAPEPFAYGIDECKINVGNGPTLAFGNESGRMFKPGMRHKSSEVIVDESIAFVDRHRDEPFYLQVWLNDTHATLDPSEEQLVPYEEMFIKGEGAEYKGARALYYATVTNADKHIGRLMDHLDESGLGENTVLIFSADNGPEDIAVPNASHSGVGSAGPFRGRKRSLYEGGVRTPFLLRWPKGGAEGGVVDDNTPLCSVDLLPTFCALAGIELPDDLPLDGEAMVDAFNGQEQTRNKPIMWENRIWVQGHALNRSPMLAIRDGDWKLLMNPSHNRVELYHIPSDPMELDNVADDHADVVERLSERVLAWQQELPDGPVDYRAGSNAYKWPGKPFDESGAVDGDREQTDLTPIKTKSEIPYANTD